MTCSIAGLHSVNYDSVMIESASRSQETGTGTECPTYNDQFCLIRVVYDGRVYWK